MLRDQERLNKNLISFNNQLLDENRKLRAENSQLLKDKEILKRRLEKEIK